MKDFVIDKSLYEKGIDSMFSKIGNLNAEDYLNNLYEEKVPEYFKNYIKPEKKYLSEIGSEFNQYINKIKDNVYDSLRNHPKESLEGLTLKVNLFSSKEDKDEFTRKISDSLEELSYAAEVMTAEGYRIWDVKSHMPGIGRIAKKQLKKYSGEEDLPPYREIKDKINDLKEGTYSILEDLGLSSKRRMPKNKVRKKYQERMKSYGIFTNDRRLLAYDLENGFEIPKNNYETDTEFKKEIMKDYSQLEKTAVEVPTFSEFKNKKERERQLEMIKSPYNSWWEKIVGYISYFFGF